MALQTGKPDYYTTFSTTFLLIQRPWEASPTAFTVSTSWLRVLKLSLLTAAACPALLCGIKLTILCCTLCRWLCLVLTATSGTLAAAWTSTTASARGASVSTNSCYFNTATLGCLWGTQAPCNVNFSFSVSADKLRLNMAVYLQHMLLQRLH